jgi:hypothetical protein
MAGCDAPLWELHALICIAIKCDMCDTMPMDGTGDCCDTVIALPVSWTVQSLTGTGIQSKLRDVQSAGSSRAQDRAERRIEQSAGSSRATSGHGGQPVLD